MAERRIAVLGAGGHAKVVIATASAAGFEIAGVFDDREDMWHREVLGHRIEGPMARVLSCHCDGGVIAVGQNSDRKVLAEHLDMSWLTVVHPSAWVCDSASLGHGTVVFANAVVQPDASIGHHAIVNTGATVDHDCEIGDYVHVAPGVRLGGNVKAGLGCLVGIGAVVVPGTSLGSWSVVGAGSVVIADVAPSTTVAGVPARLLTR